MREIDIRKQDIRCCDLYIENDNINVQYELWFDVNKYFGTNTEETDSWINFYTYWYPDGSISAVYEIDYPDTVESHDWELTEDEKEFFRNKMEEYCKKECDSTLADLYNKTREETE